MFHTYSIAPTHVPQNITEVILGPTSFLLTWEPPPIEHHNGEIREYRINITEVETGREFRFTTEDTDIIIRDLHPFYRYICTVTAVTVSEGPYSANITARTHEDGKQLNKIKVVAILYFYDSRVTAVRALEMMHNVVRRAVKCMPVFLAKEGVGKHDLHN